VAARPLRTRRACGIPNTLPQEGPDPCPISSRCAREYDVLLFDRPTLEVAQRLPSAFPKHSRSRLFGQLYRETDRREGSADGAVCVESGATEKVLTLEPDTGPLSRAGLADDCDESLKVRLSHGISARRLLVADRAA